MDAGIWITGLVSVGVFVTFTLGALIYSFATKR